eukprot:jgi/Chrpa1/4580/Chrysochromulina_OHIO_Genome00009589-RA
MGFSFLVLHALLLQAMSENRTLLSTSAFMRGHSWRWCDEGPQSHGCYFEPWSTCEDDPNLIADFLTGRRPPVQWDAPSFGKATLQHAVVRLSFAKDDRSLGIFALYARWMHCTPALGRSFWFEADGTLLVEPFVVVLVRMGGKHVEEKPLLLKQYLPPLAKLLSSTCFGTRHVLLVTETAAVVANFSAECKQRSWNCFWTDQRRFDLKIDPWNPGDYRNQYGEEQREKLLQMAFGANSRNSTPIAAGDVSSSGTSRPSDRTHPRQMQRELVELEDSASTTAVQSNRPLHLYSRNAPSHRIFGWHSILNLAIAQHGVALIGSFGSAWSQVTLQMMHQHFGGPVLGCSLRPGWKNDNLCAHALRSTPRGPLWLQREEAYGRPTQRSMRMQEEWAARAAAEEESKREAAKRVAEAAEARAAEEELMRAARQSEEAFMNRYRAKWHMDDPITRKMEAETSHESEVDSDHAHAEAAHFYADATSRPALRLPPLMPKSKSAPQLANMWVSKPVRSKRASIRGTGNDEANGIACETHWTEEI